MGLFVYRIACFCEVDFRLCTGVTLNPKIIKISFFSSNDNKQADRGNIVKRRVYNWRIWPTAQLWSSLWCQWNTSCMSKYYRRLNTTDRLADNLLKIKACTQIRGYHQTSLLWEIEHTHIQMKILSYTLKYMAINDTAYCKDSVFYWITETVG